MSEPEIAHRCGVCGAAVRGAARFCPQCGQTMTGAGDTGAQQVGGASAQPALVEEAERAATSMSGRLAARARDKAEDADDRERASSATNEANVVAQSSITPTQDAPPSHAPSTVAQTSTNTNASSPAQSTTTQVSTDAAAQSQEVKTPDGGSSAAGVRGRAAAVGASMGDSLRPRVGKLRERSVVVLDEAADDPGLRFVLVAVALFVVALLLYVFSFVLR